MNPRISIITPSYNQGKFIHYTLASVLGQDYPHIEHIVMDGGSTDETLAILRKNNDPRLQWVSEPDSGQSSAINKGMRRATGHILAYLNSDDLYLPGALAFVADYFDRHPDVMAIYGDCTTVDQDGNDLQQPIWGQPFDLKRLLTARRMIPQPAAFWRREVMNLIGLFDESLHYTMDYDYWARMAAAGCHLVYVERPLAAFRVHATSKTTRESIGFTENRLRTLDKLYSTPNLPPEIVDLKAWAYAYNRAAGVDRLWQSGQRKEARSLLRHIFAYKAPVRLKVLSLARLIDSYLHTPISAILVRLYRRAKGLDD